MVEWRALMGSVGFGDHVGLFAQRPNPTGGVHCLHSGRDAMRSQGLAWGEGFGGAARCLPGLEAAGEVGDLLCSHVLRGFGG